VVDAANGPGANFTDIASAVAAVPDGARLLVRPGSYGAFAIAGKGVTVLCEPGVHMLDAVTVSGTSKAQAVILSGLDWPVATVTTGTALLELRGCAGPVLLEAITQPGHYGCLNTIPGWCTRIVGVDAQGCGQVVLRSCTIRCTVAFADSEAVVESCRIEGENGGVLNNGNGPWLYSRVAMSLWHGHTQIVGNSTLVGGSGAWGGLLSPAGGNAAGITLLDADLRLLDGSVAAGSTVGPWNPPAAAISTYSGLNTIRTTARATILPTPGGVMPPISGAAAVVGPMPGVTSTSTSPGSSMLVSTQSEPGDLIVLLFGFPGQPLPVPGFADAFWLDPLYHFFFQVGVQNGAAPLQATLAVPNQPALRGMRVCWQSVAAGAATGLSVSNPSWALVR